MLHHLRDIITYILKVSIPCVVYAIASLPLGQRYAKYQTLPEHLQASNEAQSFPALPSPSSDAVPCIML